MNVVWRLIGVLVMVVASALPLAAQTGSAPNSSGDPDILSCSPAPCVLPPVWPASSGFVVDAPIAANPRNPNQLLLGSENIENCPPPSGLGFYTSFDGGSNWNDLVCMVPLFNGDQEYIPGVDPILGYDRNGVAYIAGFYLDDNGHTSFGFEGFEKSSDGITWSRPAPAIVRQNYTPNWCWMAVDTNAGSPYENSVYVSCIMSPLQPPATSQLVVAHSRDGGTTWQRVNAAPMQTDPARDFYTSMTVGKDGALYLTWEYCNMDHCNNVYMVSSKSSDGGNTWSKPNLVAPVTLIFPLPNTQDIGARNTPAIGVDNSTGPHSGNLYVVMYNWTGMFMQVQVVRSTDGGNTWSKPVPVAPGITHDQFFPWISVSPAGLVGVSWLDRRNDPANISYQPFAAISADGGLTFQPNVLLSAGFSNPNTGSASNFMGNYTGNTWDGPNYFVAAWMDDSQTMYMQDVVGGIQLK